MSTYIGKVQIGSSSVASIGSTLYGICTTAASTSAKTVTLEDFDNDIHGVTIFVRFTSGNSATSGVTLTVGTTSAHAVLGNCVCNENEVLAFTMDRRNSNNEITSIDTNNNTWHWIVVGHVSEVIQAATSNPADISTSASVGSSNKYAKEDHIHKIDLDEGDNNGQVKIAGQNVSVHGLGSAAFTESSTYMPKTGGEFSGNVTFGSGTTLTIPTIGNGSVDNAAATKKYVDDAISGVIAGTDAMTFKGTIGAAADNPTITSLPDGTSGHTYVSGDTYRVITAETYAGERCEIGDLIIAIASSGPNQDRIISDHWTIAQTNIDGAVIGPSSSVTNGNVVVFDGTTGKVIKDSNMTLGVSVPSNAVFTDHQYSLTTGANAYTGIGTYTANADNTTTLVSVSQGTLFISEGITFTTTAVGTALADV